MQLAINVTHVKPHAQKAMMAVRKNATGIATLAGNLNPTSITPAVRMGSSARKASVVSVIRN